MKHKLDLLPSLLTPVDALLNSALLYLVWNIYIVRRFGQPQLGFGAILAAMLPVCIMSTVIAMSIISSFKKDMEKRMKYLDQLRGGENTMIDKCGIRPDATKDSRRPGKGDRATRSVTTMRCLFSDGLRCTLKGCLCLDQDCEELHPGYGVMVTDDEMAGILLADPKLCPPDLRPGAGP